MENWYQQHEQSAGLFRLNLLFLLYKMFGIDFIKLLVWVISGAIGIFAKSGRNFSRQYKQVLNEYQKAHNLAVSRFSTIKHIRTFAYSLVDKMAANCDTKNKLAFDVQNSEDWDELQNLVNNARGAFLICNHVGNIEALSAFPENKNVIMHAFQQIGQSGIFHKFISSHSVRKNTIIHAVEDMNIGTATEMFDFLNNGDLVMMAGDRISASTPGKTLSVKILDKDCKLPAGVFRFAKSMSHPVFAVALLNTGRNRYKLVVKKLDSSNIICMSNEFADFTEKNILDAPTQWFNFYNFFK